MSWKRAGVRRIVRASALGAGPDGITMARWHWEVERAVEDSGIPFTILQPNTFMQSYFSHAPSIAASNTFHLPQGSASVSLVDVRDIAAVAAACLTEDGHEGKRYIVTGAKALSNDEIADELSSLLGRTITYTDVPPERAPLPGGSRSPGVDDRGAARALRPMQGRLRRRHLPDGRERGAPRAHPVRAVPVGSRCRLRSRRSQGMTHP
jgi:uncharacterized protein YbjT (DUF2867 family)